MIFLINFLGKNELHNLPVNQDNMPTYKNKDTKKTVKVYVPKKAD